jgi:hypothetical protein
MRIYWVVIAALVLASCGQESTESGSQSDVELWQDELPIRQPWLREHLPDQALVYMRIPNIFGLTTMPKGNALDSALRSKVNVENVQKVLQGIVDNVLPVVPAMSDPQLRLLLEHVRSPIEVSGTFLPAPASVIAVNVDIDSNEAFEEVLQGLGLELVAPLDAQNIGQIAGVPMPLYVKFDAASGLLLMHAGPGANADSFATLLGGMDRSEPHLMRSMEDQIDESGQGFFLWVNAREAMPLMQMFVPRDTLEEMIELGLEKVSALAMGFGVANGKGRFALLADVPSEDDRGFVPYVDNNLNATAVGEPDGLMIISIPTVEEFSRLEKLVLQTATPEAREDWSNGHAAVKEVMGVTFEEMLGSIGPEVLFVFDKAGDYGAVRVRDADLFNKVIASIAEKTGSAPDERKIGGQSFYHWSIPGDMGETDVDQLGNFAWFAELYTRKRDHIYWSQEGEFLYMASIPQPLIDRAAMGPDTDIGEWMTRTQHVNAKHAFLSISGTTQKLPGRTYGFYIELLQLLADIAETEIDVWSMPTAAQLGLPVQGAAAFTINLGNPTIGMELTFENNPAEMLGGMGTVAIAGVLAAIAIPAYSDYTTRAQVSEGLNLAGGPKAAVAEHYLEHGSFPDTAFAEHWSQIGGAGKYVESVVIEPGTGVIIIDYKPEVGSTGGQIVLTPTAEPAGHFNWTCEGTFADKHLPAACRS